MLCCLLHAQAWAQAGAVLATTGDNRVERQDLIISPTPPGTLLRSGDTIFTGGAGRMQVRFADGAIVSLQPGSAFRIDDYRFEAAEQRGFFSLLRGALRTATGLIGKANPQDYRLNTQSATIGIRGTSFTVEQTVCDPQCFPGSKAGMRTGVTSGKIVVSNEAGSIELRAGESAFVASANSAPTPTDVSPSLAPRSLPQNMDPGRLAIDPSTPTPNLRDPPGVQLPAKSKTIQKTRPQQPVGSVPANDGSAQQGANTPAGTRSQQPPSQNDAAAGEASPEESPSLAWWENNPPSVQRDRRHGSGLAQQLREQFGDQWFFSLPNRQALTRPGDQLSAALDSTAEGNDQGSANGGDTNSGADNSAGSDNSDGSSGTGGSNSSDGANSSGGSDGSNGANGSDGSDGSGNAGNSGSDQNGGGSDGGTGDGSANQPGNIPSAGEYSAQSWFLSLRPIPILSSVNLLLAPGSTLSFDANAGLQAIGRCPSSLCLSRGSARIAEGGHDDYAAWGRWTDGRLQLSVFGLQREVAVSANQGLHYLAGVPAVSLPASGSFAYSLSGATAPTMSTGWYTPGTFTGSAAVQFEPGAAPRVGLQGEVDIAGAQFGFTSEGGSANPGASQLTLDNNQRLQGSLHTSGSDQLPWMCHSGGCAVQINGALFGPSGERLGIGYSIESESRSTTIDGSAVFSRP